MFSSLNSLSIQKNSLSEVKDNKESENKVLSSSIEDKFINCIL